MDRCQPQKPFLPWQFLPAGPESHVTLSGHRVLERDARIRASQSVSKRQDRQSRGPSKRTGRVCRATRGIFGVGRAGSSGTNLVTSELVVTVGPHRTSYIVVCAPCRYLSNHPTMWRSRSTRYMGLPDRDSSWVSPGNRTITTGFFRYLSARNICSPPSAGGVRISASPSTNISGVVIFVT